MSQPNTPSTNKLDVLFLSKNDIIGQDKEFADEIAKAIRDNQLKLYTDPSTIIAIAKAIYDIYKLFKGGENKVEKLLEQINETLEKIYGYLYEIIEILKRLEVLFKEEAKKLVISRLRSEIRGFLVNYESYKQHPDNPQTIQEITTRYVNFQGISGQAFEYGFTHYDTVALSFAVEFAMAKFLKKDDSVIRQTAYNYKNLYFKDAIDYSIDGSIANRLNKVFTDMKSLEDVYFPQTINCGVYLLDTGSKKGRAQWFEKKLVITGNVTDGFMYQEQDTLLPPPSGNTGPREDGGRPGKNILLSHLFTFNGYTDPAIFKAKYNEAHDRYMVLKKDFNSLTAALDSCNNYIIQLDSLI